MEITLDLMKQWQSHLQKNFSLEVGLLGGGQSSLKPMAIAKSITQNKIITAN